MKKTILSICLLTASLCVSGQTVADKDLDFAKEAAEAGMMEVKLGQLAATKASSQDVKTLANHMVTDHTKANDQLKALAGTKKLNLPTSLNKEGQKNYDELSKKSGAEFDKAYAELMVKDHKKVIAKFKKESEDGKDNELKSWAAKTLPTLEHHLMMSKETEEKVNKKNISSK